MITLIFNANRIKITLSVLTLETTIGQMSTYIRPICYFLNFEKYVSKNSFSLCHNNCKNLAWVGSAIGGPFSTSCGEAINLKLRH